MKPRIVLILLFLPVLAGGQDLMVTNARILDGTGGVIASGTLEIRDGMIRSIGAGQPINPASMQIDARGRTIMPGFIDAHRHIIDGEPTEWLASRSDASMREFLEAGLTTVLSAIDDTETILELRRRTADGETIGPRLVVAGFVPLASNPRQTGQPYVDPARLDGSRPPNRPTEPATAIPEPRIRDQVRRFAESGVDAIKTVLLVSPRGPEEATLKIVVDEARRHGIPTITHAVSVEDTLAAVRAGTSTLVHTPHIGQLSPADAHVIAEAGIPMTSTLGVFVPLFDENNVPLFRDREPFPWQTLSSAGQGPVNARLLWEAGITYAYGTDTSWLPSVSLAHELRPLSLVFSPKDIVTILTRNAAIAVGLADEIGTLEPGKIADVVMLNRDPLENSSNLLDIAVVIKRGEIVVDNRRGSSE